MLTSGVELLRSPTGCETCGSCWGQPAASWMVGRRTPFPSRTTVLTSHRRIWPSGPEMVMRRQAASCWQKLRTDRSLVFPMQRTPDEEAGHWWPTPSQESDPLATERLPGCCVILEDEQALAWCPSGRKISRAELSGESVWTIWSRLPCWCTKQPRRCRTSGALPETWVEAGTELHSETLPPSLTDLYAGLPAVETTSLAAYGSPARPAEKPTLTLRGEYKNEGVNVLQEPPSAQAWQCARHQWTVSVPHYEIFAWEVLLSARKLLLSGVPNGEARSTRDCRRSHMKPC